MNEIYPVIVIAGATATGKTNAAVAAAEKFNGEIISADSMQIYRYMDIGTAKPSAEEMRGIRHYLIDELYPDEPYNVAVFKEMSENCLQKTRENGKTPIVAGGTGFYINALAKNTIFSNTASNTDIRRYYEDIAETRGKEYLYEILMIKDPLSAAEIHCNNVKRVIRALEFIEATGESIIAHNKTEKAKAVDENVSLFILDMDRKRLYDRINQRVDDMVEKGLVSEVAHLLEMGYDEGLQSMQGIGYKELAGFIRGDYGKDEAIAKTKQATRNYAKRQITWFKGQTNGIHIDAELPVGRILEVIKNEMKRRKNAD